MSIYYKDSRPDLDSSQLREMREERDARQGTNKSKSVFKKRAPKTFIRNELALKSLLKGNSDKEKTLNIPFPLFVKETGNVIKENHNKKTKPGTEKLIVNEFARKQMEKHGWKEGQGLGAKNGGIVKAIDGEIDGQMDRSGLGYKQ